MQRQRNLIGPAQGARKILRPGGNSPCSANAIRRAGSFGRGARKNPKARKKLPVQRQRNSVRELAAT